MSDWRDPATNRRAKEITYFLLAALIVSGVLLVLVRWIN
jgi:hypothetical protein